MVSSGGHYTITMVVVTHQKPNLRISVNNLARTIMQGGQQNCPIPFPNIYLGLFPQYRMGIVFQFLFQQVFAYFSPLYQDTCLMGNLKNVYVPVT